MCFPLLYPVPVAKLPLKFPVVDRRVQSHLVAANLVLYHQVVIIINLVIHAILENVRLASRFAPCHWIVAICVLPFATPSLSSNLRYVMCTISSQNCNLTSLQSAPVAPWKKIEPTFAVIPCPPCTHQVSKTCHGGHEVRQFDCSKVASFSCLRLCGRVLKCGNHTCTLKCHVVINADAISVSYTKEKAYLLMGVLHRVVRTA